MLAINILESHRHEAPCCENNVHHRLCDFGALGSQLPGKCRLEHMNKPTSASSCWHQLKSDGEIAVAISSDPLKVAFALISNWAAQNHYVLTVVFERQTGTVNDDDPSSDRYWDYDLTGEE
jgi:hypothetical protein